MDLTPDYAHATVHFSVLPDDDERVAETLRGLRAASGFLRSLIGRRVRIHTTPELHFVHDASAQRGIEMGRLIDEANSRSAADDPGDAATEAGEGTAGLPDGVSARATPATADQASAPVGAARHDD